MSFLSFVRFCRKWASLFLKLLHSSFTLFLHPPSRSFTLFHALSRCFTLFHPPSLSFTLLHAVSRSFTLFHALSRSFTLFHPPSHLPSRLSHE
jgi:hypothetical protein